MSEPTKKRRIKKDPSPFRVTKDYISAEQFFAEAFGDIPQGAVYLAGLRNREGLTQKQLEEQIGISQYNISKMERGHRPIGKVVAKKLAAFFKVDYRNFL